MGGAVNANGRGTGPATAAAAADADSLDFAPPNTGTSAFEQHPLLPAADGGFTPNAVIADSGVTALDAVAAAAEPIAVSDRKTPTVFSTNLQMTAHPVAMSELICSRARGPRIRGSTSASLQLVIAIG